MAKYNYTVQASGAMTASGAGATQTDRDATGVALAVKVTAASGTSPTLAVKVQGSVNGTDWYDIPGATTANITGVSVTHLIVCRDATVVANQAISQPLPRLWRVYWTIGGTTPSFTFSVDAGML